MTPQITDAQAAWLLARIREATAGLEGLSGPELIERAAALAQGQGRLATLSGIAPNTITALKRGKRPNQAQRAAIGWGIARAMGL